MTQNVEFEETGSLIADRVQEIQARISYAAGAAGRNPAEITLVAASKMQDEPALQAAIQAGLRVFGENRVQEAAGKWPALRARRPDLTLHLIGPLQSNKARQAVELFDVIESLDRESLAAELAKLKQRAEAGPFPSCLIQVNTGEEPQKAGILPAEADDFIERCRTAHGLTIMGLMCVPPLDEPPSLHFALLASIARRHGLPVLSMGMSGDFEIAIRHGATHVRVGSAIFGQRPPLKAQPLTI
jgi:pyridoxal phosphate enzyme (YggS family)